MTDWLTSFVRESNQIEGIPRTYRKHIEGHERFISLPRITIPALEELVSVLQPNAVFRNRSDIPGVRVGNHIAPPSGPDIETRLNNILRTNRLDPRAQHVAYENLHPFTDGNGRSGRALWLWGCFAAVAGQNAWPSNWVFCIHSITRHLMRRVGEPRTGHEHSRLSCTGYVRMFAALNCKLLQCSEISVSN